MCPNEHTDRANDRVVQNIYADNFSFITQLCSVKGYETKKKIFDIQLKKYQKLGKILNVDIKMDFNEIVILTDAMTK